MTIKVNISITAGGRLKPVASHTLAESHVSIGRDSDCTLPLEDTQKHVSRVHAELDAEDDVYLLTVVSKVNPVMVNGKRYMYGDRVALMYGDVLSVGLYKIEVLYPEDPALAAPPARAATPEPPSKSVPVAPAPIADAAEDMTYVPPAPKRSVPAAPPRRPPKPHWRASPKI
ncbi:MAG: FHA domain-containing protein [Betaproteobacteria bacterium]|nr:FHA domain-containing protein [Betaproteobacteria bacterium]